MPWDTSTRKQRLPRDWRARRDATRRRAGGRCECTGDCGLHVGRCRAPGTDCDHHQAGDNHALDNLRWLCKPCHDEKTKRESAAARAAARARLVHPAARIRHPGLR